MSRLLIGYCFLKVKKLSYFHYIHYIQKCQKSRKVYPFKNLLQFFFSTESLWLITYCALPFCRHPFSGSTGMSDVLLKMQHTVGIQDGGKRLITAVTSTGKYFSERGHKVKSSISSWFQASGPS